MATDQQIANRAAYHRGWWDAVNASSRISDHAQPTHAPTDDTRTAYMRGFDKAMEQHSWFCDPVKCVENIQGWNRFKSEMSRLEKTREQGWMARQVEAERAAETDHEVDLL